MLRYLQYSLTGLFTLVALQQTPFQLPRLMRAMAWASLLLIVVLYLQLPYFLLAVEFIPELQLHEDNLPWLLPFLLLALFSRPRSRWLLLGAIVAVALYIGLSHGRAALLAMLAALAVLLLLGLNMSKRQLLAIGMAVVAMGIVFSQWFLRGVSNFAFDFATVNRLTTYRATICRQALNSPPENPWLGIGFGNVASRVDVLSRSSWRTWVLPFRGSPKGCQSAANSIISTKEPLLRRSNRAAGCEGAAGMKVSKSK